MSPLILGLALAVAAPQAKDPPKAPSLVGEWVVESVAEGGAAAPPAARTTVTFTAEGQFVYRAGADDPLEARYAWDPSPDPPHLDVIERVGNGMRAVTLPGIARPDGDTLVVCIAHRGGRPQAFAAPAGSGAVVMVLKRVKKKE